MTEYYVALDFGDHVMYVTPERAYDSLTVRVNDDGTVDLIHLQAPDGENHTLETRRNVPHRDDEHAGIYFWVPGAPDTKETQGTPAKGTRRKHK